MTVQGRKPAEVYATIVTYNRAECLMKLLNALERQTYPLTAVVLVNNHSTDTTHEMLCEGGYADPIKEGQTSVREHNGLRYIYYLNPTNTGGSGGFAKAFEIAFEYPSDCLWIMDDDVLPEPDCLEKLLDKMDDEIGTVMPNRTDESFQDTVCLRVDMRKTVYRFFRRVILAEQPLTQDFYAIEHFPFEGPLIQTNYARKVGIPTEGFFIICDDMEYALRLKQFCKIGFVTNAKMHRQLAMTNKLEGKQFTWKDYYSIRNSILLQRKYGETFGAKYLSPVLCWCWWFALSVYKRRFRNIAILNRAFIDGINERYGKTVEPS